MNNNGEEPLMPENIDAGSISVGALLKLLTAAFGAWALVVGWGIQQVTSQISKISSEQGEFTRQFNGYVLAMERRVTVLESEHRRLLLQEPAQ